MHNRHEGVARSMIFAGSESTMLNALRKIKYAARVFLARNGGEPQTIDVAGRSTVLLHGGSGPTFVYLHSTFGEAVRWLPFYQSWSRDFSVTAPTHPGFGATGFDQIDTIEDMAFHYIELFDALGLDEIILGGVSLGGWIAAEIACRWPERIKKLWLSGAPGLWVEDSPLPDLFREMTNPQLLRERLFHDPTGPMATLLISDKPEPEKMLAAYQAMTVLARLVWDRPYDPKLAARLRRVRCPVLLLWGDHDTLVPPAYGEAYRQCLPHAEWKLLEKCGHMMMFEKENEFARAVADFARS